MLSFPCIIREDIKRYVVLKLIDSWLLVLFFPLTWLLLYLNFALSKYGAIPSHTSLNTFKVNTVWSVSYWVVYLGYNTIFALFYYNLWIISQVCFTYRVCYLNFTLFELLVINSVVWVLPSWSSYLYLSVY